MHQPRTNTVEYPHSPEEIFHTVLGLVRNGRYTLVAVHDEHLRLQFTSGRSGLLRSQEYDAVVHTDGDGFARLELTCGSRDGAG